MKNYTAQEVQKMRQADSLTLIDVREPSEYARERIEGALLQPLSSFDPQALPTREDKPIVFYCAAGVRSAVAVLRCQAAHLPHSAHLAGGLSAWHQAGLPTVKD